MLKASTRYTNYDKDLILAAIKVGAQNGTHQDDIAASIAPLLQRTESAIIAQMYAIRSEWVKEIQMEMTLSYSKVKSDKEEIHTLQTECGESFGQNIEQAEPDDKSLPKIGDEIDVVVTKLADFGAFVRAKDHDLSGLIHISNISNGYVQAVDDWLFVSQVVKAKITKIEDGRYGFSTKDTLTQKGVNA